MAFAAAAIFLLQMLNVPVASGTSGHFLGAAFAVLFLGLYPAVMVMGFVLLVQTLVFGDGGFIAYGANAFNMAIVATYAAHYARQCSQHLPKTFSYSLSGIASMIAATFVLSLELAVSGTTALASVLPAMWAVHAFAAIGEAALTIGLVYALSGTFARSPWKSGLAFFIAVFAFSAIALPFASALPDGLQSVSLQLGFFSQATIVYQAPLNGYSMAALNGLVSTAGIALMGATLCFAVFGAWKWSVPSKA